MLLVLSLLFLSQAKMLGTTDLTGIDSWDQSEPCGLNGAKPPLILTCAKKVGSIYKQQQQQQKGRTDLLNV